MPEAVNKLRHSAYGLAIADLDLVVVDDDPAMCDFLRIVCSTLAPSRIRVFTSAQDALADMRGQPPNMAIVDWMMKPIDGLTLVRRMRRRDSEALCLVPVVMMSAQATLPFVNKAMAAGAHQILAKPMLPATVSARINSLLTDPRSFILQDDYFRIDGAPPAPIGKIAAKERAEEDQLYPTGKWEL